MPDSRYSAPGSRTHGMLASVDYRFGLLDHVKAHDRVGDGRVVGAAARRASASSRTHSSPRAKPDGPIRMTWKRALKVPVVRRAPRPQGTSIEDAQDRPLIPLRTGRRGCASRRRWSLTLSVPPAADGPWVCRWVIASVWRARSFVVVHEWRWPERSEREPGDCRYHRRDRCKASSSAPSCETPPSPRAGASRRTPIHRRHPRRGHPGASDGRRSRDHRHPRHRRAWQQRRSSATSGPATSSTKRRSATSTRKRDCGAWRTG